MAFPPAADPTIEWAKLGLVLQDMGAVHVESRYTVATGKWSAPRIVQDPMLRIHGMAPALNYGMQAYEGLKAFRSPSGPLLLFRPSRHARRMATSTAAVSIPAIPEAHFEKCVELAVASNARLVPPASSGACLYVRPVAMGVGPHMSLSPPAEYLFVVYAHPFATYHGVAPLNALILDDFDRAAPRGTGHAKIGGNYAPVMQHTDKARAQGFPLTLHMDPATRSYIDEFSTSAFLGLTRSPDGHVTLVQPDSNTVIDSVTADSASELARSFGWTVERRPVPYSELSSFTEVLAAGTAASLVPVRSITRHTPNGDETAQFGSNGSELFQKLYDGLRGIQAGTQPDPFGWCCEVHAPEHYEPAGIESPKAQEAAPAAAAKVSGPTASSKTSVVSAGLSSFAAGAALMGFVSVLAANVWK